MRELRTALVDSLHVGVQAPQKIDGAVAQFAQEMLLLGHLTDHTLDFAAIQVLGAVLDLVDQFFENLFAWSVVVHKEQL